MLIEVLILSDVLFIRTKAFDVTMVRKLVLIVLYFTAGDLHV